MIVVGADYVGGVPEAFASAHEKAALRRTVKQLREQVLRDQRERGRSDHDGLFEKSPRMKAIKQMIEQLADTDVTVLVWGESGVGKELVARAIHDSSIRRAGACVKVNCAALPAALLESELFGYERGAFTGADRVKPGKFELADGGTMFLDEIGEMPLSLQAKLLQVLQDHEFSRLGSDRDIKVDVRVVASTNKNLEKAVAQRRFREDLYYRLNVVNILVPPLRDRPEEIPILAEHFCQKYTSQYNRQPVRLSPEILERFLAHSWPGNIRELENFIKRIVVLESEGLVLLELVAREAGLATAGGAAATRAAPALVLDLALVPAVPGPALAWVPGIGLKEIGRRAAHEAERVMILQVLEEVRWNRREAARRLRISYKALLYKIRMFDVGTSSPGKSAA